MMVLVSFLLALGIVVDDAIVVIENTHRIYDNGKMEIKKAAKIAAGEVFLPVLSGTIVTLAPFIPLLFWPGVIGKFMFFLPATLIIALRSEEHTSELQSIMRISYAVFCLKNKQ